MALQQLKSSFPGLIPLFILIAAEWIWGMVTGLWLAVGYGLGEIVYYAVRHHRKGPFGIPLCWYCWAWWH
jgi:hypothetical protein